MSAMKITLLLVLLAMSSGASERISEQTAVAQLKKTPAYELDGALPNRTFGSWVTDKFRDWDIQWTMHECGDIKLKTNKGDFKEEGPVCVQVNIMQPGQKIHGDASDGYHVLFLVGTEKHGLITPRLFNATRRNGDEIENVVSLGEVEP
jgi:hypothetical protein